jgi:prolyl-tRNA editing enzyme YbaK/EbsC (Cys-tRNA(Pro) deacylase)
MISSPPCRVEGDGGLERSVGPRIHRVYGLQGVGQQAAHELQPMLGDLDASGFHPIAHLVQRHGVPPLWENTAAMIERRVVQALDATGVPYELMEIDPAFADTAACCEKYGLPLDSAGNTIVVASKKEPRRFGACVVKATTRLDVNHAVRALLGVNKVSFATAEETKALTGMMLGGVTVFALPSELPIYVDDKLMAREWVILGSGSRSSKIKISPEVFRRLPNATIVPGLSIDI